MKQSRITTGWGKLLSYVGSRPVLKRLLGGAFWTLIGTAVTRAFSLVTNIGVARILGKEDFGAYGILNATLETFSVFGGLAFGYAMVKYIAEYRVRDPVKAGLLLGAARTAAYLSAGLFASVLFLFSDRVAASVLNRPDLDVMLKIGAAYMFIRTVNNIQIGVLAGFEAFRETARINTVSGLLTPAFTLPLVYWFDLTGAVLALLAVALVSYVYCGIVFKQKCIHHNISVKLVQRSSRAIYSELFSFSVPAFLTGLCLIPVSWLTNALLANQPGGYSELGLFNAANQWRQFVIFIPSMMSLVMIAVSADSYAEGTGGNYRQAYLTNMRLTWCCALPAAVVIITFGKSLNYLFGQMYADAAGLIPPLIAAAFFSVLNTVASSAVAGAGRMWAEAALNLIWAVLLGGLSLWLVPSYGAYGLAYAFLFATIGQVAVRLVYIERELISHSLADFRNLLALTVGTMGGAMYLAWDEKLNIWWGAVLAVVSAIPILEKAKNIFGPTETI